MAGENFKVGEYLKAKREEQKTSLDDVVRVTKISPMYLRYLEQDELHRQVEPVFFNGYLRCYAKFLHLDPDDVVSRHQASLASETEPLPPPRKSDSAFASLSRHALNTFVDAIWTVLGAAPSFSVGKTVLPPKH